ncbi:IS1182 family transposase [Paenibacillus planticolens]|uniref:IS1182 family transposase n=1 Tax=Paenibacillus planticolens TaxID=2654976 RepID=UPI0035E42608
MFRSTPKDPQLDYELVCIDLMVPQNHLLRQIAAHIDFSFILDIVRPFYSENHGRPSIDPILFFKMMFIGYLYGIRSERQLEQEVNLNIAYRWFLGLGLSQKAPDHTTISWNRRTRFKDTTVFQDIFDEIVRLAIEHRMVGGRVLITDSTHIKAKANKNKYTIQTVEHTPYEYTQELDKAVDEDREQHGKKQLERKEEVNETKQIKVSTTDPDSGYMMRKGKPEGFFYLDHRTVDHKFNIITDVHVTKGNVNDSVVYLERLQHQIQKFGFETTLEAVALDNGYFTPHICKETLEMKIYPVIAGRSTPSTSEGLSKDKFIFNEEKNVYICPKGQELTYSTTNRQGYREYTSDAKQCKNCPLLSTCTTAKNYVRKIQRHLWESFKERVARNKKSISGKKLYRLRCQTIERSFADAKELHGLRCSQLQGQANVQEKALMTAIAQNVKKIARQLAKHAS